MTEGITLGRAEIDSFVQNCGDNKEADMKSAILRFGPVIINSISSDGDWTPMGKASASGHLSILEYLHSSGGDVNFCNSNGWTPIFLATLKNQVECLEFIISHGAALDEQKQDGYTALHLAANWSRKECVARLLDAGASTTIRNNNGKVAIDMVTRKEILVVFHKHAGGSQPTSNADVTDSSDKAKENDNAIIPVEVDDGATDIDSSTCSLS